MKPDCMRQIEVKYSCQQALLCLASRRVTDDQPDRYDAAATSLAIRSSERERIARWTRPLCLYHDFLEHYYYQFSYSRITDRASSSPTYLDNFSPRDCNIAHLNSLLFAITAGLCSRPALCLSNEFLATGIFPWKFLCACFFFCPTTCHQQWFGSRADRASGMQECK